MTTPPPAAKPRRRWLQFSLRTLLVLALGAGLGWLAHEVHQARQQRGALKAIALRHPRVSYAPNRSRRRIETGLAWLRELVGEEELFKTLIEVGFVGRQGNHRFVILQLLRESIRQASHPPAQYSDVPVQAVPLSASKR